MAECTFAPCIDVKNSKKTRATPPTTTTSNAKDDDDDYNYSMNRYLDDSNIYYNNDYLNQNYHQYYNNDDGNNNNVNNNVNDGNNDGNALTKIKIRMRKYNTTSIATTTTSSNTNTKPKPRFSVYNTNTNNTTNTSRNLNGKSKNSSRSSSSNNGNSDVDSNANWSYFTSDTRYSPPKQGFLPVYNTNTNTYETHEIVKSISNSNTDVDEIDFMKEYEAFCASNTFSVPIDFNADDSNHKVFFEDVYKPINSTSSPSTAVSNNPSTKSTSNPSTAVSNKASTISTSNPSTVVSNKPSSSAVSNKPSINSGSNTSIAVSNKPSTNSNSNPSTAVSSKPSSNPSTAVSNKPSSHLNTIIDPDINLNDILNDNFFQQLPPPPPTSSSPIPLSNIRPAIQPNTNISSNISSTMDDYWESIISDSNFSPVHYTTNTAATTTATNSNIATTNSNSKSSNTSVKPDGPTGTTTDSKITLMTSDEANEILAMWVHTQMDNIDNSSECLSLVFELCSSTDANSYVDNEGVQIFIEGVQSVSFLEESFGIDVSVKQAMKHEGSNHEIIIGCNEVLDHIEAFSEVLQSLYEFFNTPSPIKGTDLCQMMNTLSESAPGQYITTNLLPAYNLEWKRY